MNNMKKLNTNEKILEIVKIALETRNEFMLWRISEIITKRAEYESKLNDFLKTIKN
jgi:hypothetical protein